MKQKVGQKTTSRTEKNYGNSIKGHQAYTLTYVRTTESETRKEEGEREEEVGRRKRNRGGAAAAEKEQNGAEATFEEIITHHFQK